MWVAGRRSYLVRLFGPRVLLCVSFDERGLIWLPSCWFWLLFNLSGHPSFCALSQPPLVVGFCLAAFFRSVNGRAIVVDLVFGCRWFMSFAMKDGAISSLLLVRDHRVLFVRVWFLWIFGGVILRCIVVV